MDIRKLQRAIVDGLEDVKAQDIVVFNTEHLSPLFERVIVASGASNRQTKALAASVRDAVKAGGMQVLSTEGGDNGEWIIVDCGAAVAHIMQPAIREYYRLEEIWGGKAVKIKLGAVSGGLVKASASDDDDDDALPAKPKRGGTGKSGIKPAVKRAGSYKAPASKAGRPASSQAAASKPAAKKAAARQAAAQRAAPDAPAAKRPAAKRGAAQDVVSRTIVVKPAAKRTAAAKKTTGRAAPGQGAARPAAKKVAARPVGAKKVAAKKAAPRRAPGRG